MRPQSTLAGVALGIVLALPGSGICAPAPYDCARSEPTPVFDMRQAGIPTHCYFPVSSHEAREYIVLTTGESLEIRLGGCEYFVTTFRVQSPRISRRIKAGSEASPPLAIEGDGIEFLQAQVQLMP